DTRGSRSSKGECRWSPHRGAAGVREANRDSRDPRAALTNGAAAQVSRAGCGRRRFLGVLTCIERGIDARNELRERFTCARLDPTRALALFFEIMHQSKCSQKQRLRMHRTTFG